MNILIEVIAVVKLIENWRRKTEGKGISFLVPFQCKDEKDQRVINWLWLQQYWKCHFPKAEIIVGVDKFSEKHPGIPFSKSAAVNDAASKAHGDVFVIVDADGYITSKEIKHCVHQIREAREEGKFLWFVPYRQFFRLNQKASQKLLDSEPCNPYKFREPPDSDDIQNCQGSQHGHWFGAGIQIVPREAFDCVGGWDERFRGWGGEDHANMRACDTLYWPHKTRPGQYLHVWHPMFDPKAGTKDWVEWTDRAWNNQTEAGANDDLSARWSCS